MQLTPLIAIHMAAALAAVVIGPVALWARRGHAHQVAGSQRPRLHRAAGYAWVTLMLVTAISAIFISDPVMPNIAGFSAIHLLIPVVLGMLFLAFRFLLRGNIRGHRLTMVLLYIGGCIGAGAFALMPERFLGQLVWNQWLGVIPTHHASQPTVPPATEHLALQRQPR
ncbi:DUF2306 domain-containing protein [Hydrogenophaga sp.]|uniref:DUF2306 domain-containing protein n=1 Tax=Hydrogenophaga sp. TaxID=1904254 RepID=UPI0027FDF309|nr:DUF2306 domain-containing protein [Hydrogenophaga sp.]